MGALMTRLEDWPARLSAVLSGAFGRPFSWQDHNCCLFVGECIEACTGENPVAQWANTCSNAREAQRILSRVFGGSLLSGWTKLLGEPVPPAFAGRGDVVLIEIDGEQACGVVDMTGERVAVLSLDEMAFLPLTAAVAAWKV